MKMTAYFYLGGHFLFGYSKCSILLDIIIIQRHGEEFVCTKRSCSGVGQV